MVATIADASRSAVGRLRVKMASTPASVRTATATSPNERKTRKNGKVGGIAQTYSIPRNHGQSRTAGSLPGTRKHYGTAGVNWTERVEDAHASFDHVDADARPATVPLDQLH